MLEETPWLQLCPLNNGPRGPFSSSDRHHDVQCLCSASHLSLLLGTRWKLQKLGQSLATPLLCSQTYHTDSRKVHPPVPADGLSVCPHPTNKNLGEVIGHLCSLVTCHCACHFWPELPHGLPSPSSYASIPSRNSMLPWADLQPLPPDPSYASQARPCFPGQQVQQEMIPARWIRHTCPAIPLREPCGNSGPWDTSVQEFREEIFSTDKRWLTSSHVTVLQAHSGDRTVPCTGAEAVPGWRSCPRCSRKGRLRPHRPEPGCHAWTCQSPAENLTHRQQASPGVTASSRNTNRLLPVQFSNSPVLCQVKLIKLIKTSCREGSILPRSRLAQRRRTMSVMAR